MPCYEVNLISVRFSGKSIALLRAIGGVKVKDDVWQVDGVTIDLAEGTMRGEQSEVNEVKRRYSAAAVKVAARKNGWTLTKKSAKAFVAVKY